MADGYVADGYVNTDVVRTDKVSTVLEALLWHVFAHQLNIEVAKWHFLPTLKSSIQADDHQTEVQGQSIQ